MQRPAERGRRSRPRRLLVIVLLLGACGLWPGAQGPCLPGPGTIRFLQRLALPVGPADVPTETRAIPQAAGPPHAADVYRAAGGLLGTLLLVPGAAESGRSDPRLRHLARTMADSGIAVLVPEIPLLQALQVRPEITAAVRQAFLYLVRQPDLAPRGRAGIFAISFAGGPALLAALQPDVGSRLDLVFCLGGYYAMEPLLTFLTTGWYQDEQGRWRHREPNRYGQWVYVLSHLDTVAAAADQRLLKEMAERRLADAQAGIADLAVQLGPEGQAIYDLVSNRDPSRVPALLSRLPAPARQRLQQLDLSRQDLSGLTAPVILLHGRNDAVIPYGGSLALHGALPTGRSQLFLVDGLDHIDVQDMAEMACAVEAIFQALAKAGQRDGRRQKMSQWERFPTPVP